MYKRYRKGVFCVIHSGKEFLLLHRKLHWQGWEFCKGGRLANERLEHAAKREIKEETGLRVEELRKFSTKGVFIYDKKTKRERKAKGFAYVLFSAEVKKRKVKTSKKEHDAYRWCDYKTSLKLLMWPNQKKCLRTVARHLKIK